tara:strand:- start:170 stop:484 length:315 start_codon:yes stop_codon:yes gene_type:complete
MLEDQERFEEIIGEISELAREALDLLPEDIQENARSYWYSHILCALNDDHEFIGGSMLHMNDSLEEWSSNNNSNYEFNSQEEWDDYVARNGLSEELKLDEEDWD